MQLADRLNQLVPDLLRTALRFPICCLAALLASCIANLDVASVIDLRSDDQTRIYLSLTATFLAGGAGHLFAEARRWPQLNNYALASFLAAALGLVHYFDSFTSADPLFLIPAALLLAMTAAYLRDGATEKALWLFNARFGLTAVLAFIVALVFCGGLSAILASLDYLFDVKIDDDLYSHIWASGATLIGPVYGLSLMPHDFDEELTLSEPPALIDRGISALINYILAPMILIYLVILYLYAGKIAVEWSLPKGQIGIMVLVFGLGGTATYLISRPWADRGTRALRWFLDSWFWLTIVPVGLLAIAVYRRIADYGVTPERYGLVLVGIWLIAMVIYFAMRRRRVAGTTILISLATLLLVGAFGPWGAKGLSISSQLNRLETLLISYGYLKDGKLVERLPDSFVIPGTASAEGASIVDYLRQADALDRLEPIFSGRAGNPFELETNEWALAKAIKRQLEFGMHVAGGRTVHFNGYKTAQAALTGDLMLFGPVTLNRYTAQQGVRVQYIDGDLVIKHGISTWRHDAEDLMRQIEKHQQIDKTRHRAFKLEIAGTTGRATVMISNMVGEIGGSKERLRSITLWAVLPKAEP